MSNKPDSRTDGIEYTDNADNVTITITGEAFNNLKEIAGIFSCWAGSPTTPAGIIAEFALPDEFTALARCKSGRSIIPTLPSVVCSACCDAPHVNDLERAFATAGFEI